MSTKKERRRQKIEERRRQLIREQLEREIALGALNAQKYRTAWRRMMMRIKLPTIKQNVEVAWHTFERALDIKDFRISVILDILDVGEDQYRRNEMHHVETIDNLFKFYEEKVHKQSMIYEGHVEMALKEKAHDVDVINGGSSGTQLDQERILRNITWRVEETLNNAQSATMSKIDAFVEDSRNERRLAAGQLQKRLENLWDDLRSVFSEYQERTYKRGKAYAIIVAKDTRDRQILAQQVTQTANLFESIRKLREKIAAYKEKSKEEIKEINNENDFFHNAYWTVKNRFLSEQKGDRAQLTVTTIEYNLTVRYLESVVTNAEHLLLLAQTCRKFQTQDEKIIPFVAPVHIQVDDDPRLNTVDNFSEQPTYWEDSLMDRIEAENKYAQLRNFWRRLGSAQIITTELRLERDKLKAQAVQLRDRLKGCLSPDMGTTFETEHNENSCRESTA